MKRLLFCLLLVVEIVNGQNQPPRANAGADTYVLWPNSSVVLNGSSSYDSDGTIAGYRWSVVTTPAAFAFTFSNAFTASPTITNLQLGTYVFRLHVTDNSGAVGTDDITVNVTTIVPRQGTSDSFSYILITPVEDAGKFITVKTNQGVCYDFLHESVPNGDGTYNTPIKNGFNLTNRVPNIPQFWYSMEPNFVGMQEAHLEVRLPNNEQARLYSTTFNGGGGTMATSWNQWDFRATSFNIMNLTNAQIFNFSPSTNSPRFSITGSFPNIRLTNSGQDADFTHQTGRSLWLTGAGLRLLGQDEQGFSAVVHTQHPGQSSVINFLNSTGHYYLLGRSGPSYTHQGMSNVFYLRNYFTGYDLVINNGNTILGLGARNLSDNGARLQVVGDITTSGSLTLGNLPIDPEPRNGAIYYNTTTNKFRGCEGGVWVNLIPDLTSL